MTSIKRMREQVELTEHMLAAAQARLDKIAEVVNRYAEVDDDRYGDDPIEYTEPEDVWRLFRDLRAAGVPKS